MTERQIAETHARLEIQDVLHRYARAMDRMDAELALSCWHPGGTDDHAPLYSDLVAVAEVPGAAALEALLAKLDQRGRGGIVLEASVRDGEGQPVTTLSARYAAVVAR